MTHHPSDITRAKISRSLKNYYKKHPFTKLHRERISKGLKRFYRRQKEHPAGITYENDIEGMLKNTLQGVMDREKLDGDLRREINADMSIDWELRFSLPRGYDPKELMITLGTLLKPSLNAWIGIGYRFLSDRLLNSEPERKAEYDRYKDGLQVNVHYQLLTRGKIVTQVLGAQDLLDNLRTNERREPYEAFVRLYWSLSGKRPS